MNIKKRRLLAQYPQVQAAVCEMLEPAIATGMSEKRAEAIYDEIMSHYAQIPGEGLQLLQGNLASVLFAADEPPAKRPNSSRRK